MRDQRYSDSSDGNPRTGEPQAPATQTTKHSPQPRPLGMLFALFSILIVASLVLLALFASQQARLLVALRIVGELRVNAEVEHTPKQEVFVRRLELLRQHTKMLDSFDYTDDILHFVREFSLSIPPTERNSVAERELLKRLLLANSALHSDDSGSRVDLPVALLAALPKELMLSTINPKEIHTAHSSRDPSVDPTAASGDRLSAANHARLLESLNNTNRLLERVDGELKEIRTAWAYWQESSTLVESEALRLFSLPANTPAESSQIVEVSRKLYSSGILEGIPVLSKIPDALPDANALADAIAHAGGSAAAQEGKNLAEVQSELENLTRAGRELLARQASLRERESAAKIREESLVKRQMDVLGDLESLWTELLEQRLNNRLIPAHLIPNSIRMLSSDMGIPLSR